MRRRLARTLFAAGSAAAVAVATLTVLGTGSAQTAPHTDPAITVRGSAFVDSQGREVVLRGFNVSGEVKLDENGGLPFATVADARRSAAAMRHLTGANSARFLLSWAYAEPEPGRLDQRYLQRVTEQVRAFTDEGIHVLLDYHQDLYSRYLFNPGSWYTGDGAPRWVVAAGNYPREYCGICPQWGQNITQNAAVKEAMYDFWHNRELNTPAGRIRVQDAFLNQTQGTLSYLREHLDARSFSYVLGLDPYNEPYAGRYDPGQNSLSWERDLLLPFFHRIRQRMDAAGWQDKPAFIEPSMFWDANLDFMRQPGGFPDAGPLGPRFVFNSHFYDQKAISGIFMWGKAKDGQYSHDFTAMRERAAALDTAGIVTEFGHPITGYTSDKMPSVLKGMYQALDSGVKGADWWREPARSGSVLSGSQWHWDIYHGRHRELMNGNPGKVQTAGDAWNGEDFSAVALDDTGTPYLRLDPRVLDRVYPAAVSGRTLAFTYEDRARDGDTTMTWNPVPDSMPNVKRLVGAGQYAVLVWRSAGGAAPTEVQLPATFTPTNTSVISDLGGPAIGLAGRRLTLSAPATAGQVHYALIANGAQAPSAELRDAARRELAGWIGGRVFP